MYCNLQNGLCVYIHTVYKKQRQLFKSKIPINLIPETRMPVTRVPKQFREIQQERENFEKYDARFFQISRKRNFDKYDTRFSSDFTKTKFRGTLIVCVHPLYIENVSFFKFQAPLCVVPFEKYDWQISQSYLKEKIETYKEK